jgi:hypothetical protein
VSGIIDPTGASVRFQAGTPGRRMDFNPIAGGGDPQDDYRR